MQMISLMIPETWSPSINENEHRYHSKVAAQVVIINPSVTTNLHFVEQVQEWEGGLVPV